jgi:hypothetical protein
VNFTPLRTMVTGFLTDTCTITTSSTIEYDETLGHDVDTAGDEVYAGVCRVRPAAGDRVIAIGEGTVTLRLFDVTLPWDATGIEVGQLVTIDASSDPHMVDRELRVADVQGGTDTAYRRLVCEDTLSISDPEAGS